MGRNLKWSKLALLVSMTLGIFLQANFAFAYSGSAAASYADSYAINPNWGTYGIELQDDCTDFVSQSLAAGGLPQETDNGTNVKSDPYEWWFSGFGSTASYTWAWSAANNLRNFLLYYSPYPNYFGSDYGTYSGDSTYPVNDVYTGDPLFYDWTSSGTYDHAAIQVAYGNDTNLAYDNQYLQGDLIDEHTNNRYHAFWTLIQYNSQFLTTTIDAVRIVQ